MHERRREGEGRTRLSQFKLGLGAYAPTAAEGDTTTAYPLLGAMIGLPSSQASFSHFLPWFSPPAHKPFSYSRIVEDEWLMLENGERHLGQV